MASELRVNTLKDASGNNSIATSFVAGGSAKSWINFNGTGTIAIRDSLNVGSITDDGTGTTDINFTSSMNNDDYSVTCGNGRSATGNTSAGFQPPTNLATNTFILTTLNGSGTVTDYEQPMAQITGDLA